MKQITVRDLKAGDVLPSGFVVAATPVRLTRTPRGKVVVRGNYPGKPIREHLWNPSTTITIQEN